ncbi:MAG: hypothetical protein LBB13_01075 [Rickettsiales bacterium]|jgi:hypothetical protein|nr:hypothetical protein [Rickettsiales bacterium]
MISKKNLKNIILAGIDRDIVLFEDMIDTENIETEYVNEYRFISDEARKFIDHNFESKQGKAKELVDRGILGLTAFDFYGGKIFINFEKDSYKTYLATLEPEYREYIAKENFFIVPISTIDIVVTKDKKIIINRTEKGQLNVICGLPDSGDVVAEKIDFVNYFLREITGKIGNLYLFDAKLLGIFKSDRCFLVVRHSTTLYSREVEEIYGDNIRNGVVPRDIGPIDFIRDREDDIGEAIKSSNFSRETRSAFKFYIKNIFHNYKYLNTKIE